MVMASRRLYNLLDDTSNARDSLHQLQKTVSLAIFKVTGHFTQVKFGDASVVSRDNVRRKSSLVHKKVLVIIYSIKIDRITALK